MSGILPVSEIASSVCENGLEAWGNGAIVPQKRRFSELEEQVFENQGDSGAADRSPIQHWPVRQIEASGMGYSSLGQMTDFCLALAGAANPHEPIEEAVDRELPMILDASGVREPLGQEEAEPMESLERLNPLDYSHIKKDMKDISDIEYQELSRILTPERRSHFLDFCRKEDPLFNLCNFRKMTTDLLMKVLYFLVFTRDLTEEAAFDCAEIWTKYYPPKRKIKDFRRCCHVWEHRRYRCNDPSIAPSNSKFVSACYSVFLTLNMLWVFEAIARDNELLTAEDRSRLIYRFSHSPPEAFEHLRGYWKIKNAGDLAILPDKRDNCWQLNSNIKGNLKTELYGLKNTFEELAKTENRDKDIFILSNIRDKLVAVTRALQLRSISKMLKGWRIFMNKEVKQEENLGG
jgi:hypothetical protein